MPYQGRPRADVDDVNERLVVSIGEDEVNERLEVSIGDAER